MRQKGEGGEEEKGRRKAEERGTFDRKTVINSIPKGSIVLRGGNSFGKGESVREEIIN